MIYTTIGLYKNGHYVINGVTDNDIEYHLEYNTRFRYGRALFVDGKCIQKGYLSEKEIRDFEVKINSDKSFILTECTKPYK